MTFYLLAMAVLIAPARPKAITRLLPGPSDPQPTRRTNGTPFDWAARWDLLAACLRAGLTVPTAISAIDVPKLRPVADELALGADPETAWADAANHPETAQLAVAARRSARSGAALATAVAELANKVRADAANLAEARAQRAAVLVAGPLALCFLPAFLCVGVLPVVLGLAATVLEH